MSKKSSNFAADFEMRLYVRRLFTIIVLLSCVLGMMAQSEEPVIITAPDTVIEKTAYTLSEQGITIAVSYGSAYPATHSYNHTGYTYFACLANSSITFSADQPMKGIAVNGWVKKNFTASSNKGFINYLSDEEKQAFLEKAVHQYAGIFIDEKQYPLYSSLLSTYYLSGANKTALKIWDYALSYPIKNFNNNAQDNHAYSFLINMLLLLAVLNCAGGILFKEDL